MAQRNTQDRSHSFAQGHYTVYANKPGRTLIQGETTLETLAGLLPHGSGLDSDWRIHVRRTDARRKPGLTLYTEWHAMEDGMYIGYFPVRIMLARNTDTGAYYVHEVRINMRKTDDAGEYLGDLMQDVCDALNPPPIPQSVAESADASVTR